MAAMLIGTRVRQLRRAQKVKQSDLAVSVGISASYLNLIEHNKRPVAGKLLLALAAELDVSAAYLAQNADSKMLERFHQTARRLPAASAELSRIDEFIGRFPGWADLLDDQIQKTEAQADTLASLSDQFHHDPVLRDTLHIMLTNITAIRSTAEILVLHGALEPEQRARFDANIFQESKRLARKAEELLAAFDPDVHLEPSLETGEGHPNTNATHIPSEQALSSQDESTAVSFIGRYVPALEDLKQPVEEILSSTEFIAYTDTEATKSTLQNWANEYRRAASALPIDMLIDQADMHGFDPFIIAETYKIDVPLVFFRLAHLPETTTQDTPNKTPEDARGMPQFGLLEIDNSAGVLLRKELRALRLPNRSGACPRWPVYRALSWPRQGIVAQLNPIDGLPCISYSYAWQTRHHLVGPPPLMHSMMLYREIGTQSERVGYRQPIQMSSAPSSEIDVGFHCAICARTNCSDRREAYALTG